MCRVWPGFFSLQFVTGNSITIGSQNSGTSIATCPAGKTGNGGGYNTEVPVGSSSIPSNMQVFSSLRSAINAWSVSGFNTDNSKRGRKDLILISYVICAVVQP